MSLTAIQSVLESLLQQPRLGLLTDVDGTISAIAPTPNAASVSPNMRSLLHALQPHLAVLAAVSGRGAADAAALVDVPGLVVLGNHGLEHWSVGKAQPVPEALPYVGPISDLLAAAEAQLNLSGLLFENKGVTASVHYRQTPDPASAEQTIGNVLTPLATQHGLRLTRGRMIWEVRPPLAIDKGSAVRRLVGEYDLAAAIFLGDDWTDVDAFVALHELRAAGTCQTLNIGVLAAETPPPVREHADLLVDGIAGVETLLGVLLRLIQDRSFGQSLHDSD